MNRSSTDRFLIRFNLNISYVLIAVVISMLVAGFRMTDNFIFIPRGLADLLHRMYLNVAFVLLFLTHTLLSLRIVLKRRGIGGKGIDIPFILIGVGLFGYFTHMALKLILPL